MVNQLDTSALDPGATKSLQDIQVQQGLENQKLQSGKIANAQAASVYGAQALTAAAASGDPTIWKAAKQHASDLGMDTSSLSDDVTQGAAQINALRQAQYNSNPLVAALGLGIKEQQAAATAAGVNGTTAPTGPVNPITGGALNLGGAAPSAPAAQPVAAPAGGAPAPGNAGMALPVANMQAAPTAAQVAAVDPGSALPQIQASDNQGHAPDIMSAARMRAINQIGPLMPNANPKTKMDWENQVNDLVNKDPAVMQAQQAGSATGSEQGKNLADAQKALNVMVNNIPAIVSRTNAIIKNSPLSSSGLGVDAAGNGIAPDFDTTKLGQLVAPGSADANANLQKLAAQESFPGITAALSNASMKGNKFLETLANSALSINMKSPADTKVKLANQNLTQYIQQVLAAAGQARANGQADVPTDQMILSMFTSAGAKIPQQFIDAQNAQTGGSATPPAGNTLKTPSGISYSVVQ